MHASDDRIGAQMACLGVLDEDWADLGQAAVQQLRLDIAALVYERAHDAHMAQAVHALSARITAGLPHALAVADALATLAR
jgi:hypothetical protein